MARAKALGRHGQKWAHRRGLLSHDVYVAEYPRAGGTWVRRMVVDLLAAAGRSTAVVTHCHWAHSPHLRPAVYVLRDGRDVVVSFWYYHLLERRRRPAMARHIDPFLAEVAGDLDEDNLADIRSHLPRFIEALAERPMGGMRRPGAAGLQPWPDHVTTWTAGDEVLAVRYEDLLSDTAGTLGTITRHLSIDLPARRLQQVARDHSFAATSGRPPGQEDVASTQRKGVVGDWRNHFSQEAARVFDALGGDVLIDLNYEPDRSWIDRVG